MASLTFSSKAGSEELPLGRWKLLLIGRPSALTPASPSHPTPSTPMLQNPAASPPPVAVQPHYFKCGPRTSGIPGGACWKWQSLAPPLSYIRTCVSAGFLGDSCEHYCLRALGRDRHCLVPREEKASFDRWCQFLGQTDTHCTFRVRGFHPAPTPRKVASSMYLS